MRPATSLNTVECTDPATNFRKNFNIFINYLLSTSVTFLSALAIKSVACYYTIN